MSTSTSGHWPVLLSGRAIRELRLLSEDKKTLKIVQTKLKELSSGQFTKNNYRPVQGSCEHIPIYRARLSNDLRIIYAIDLVLDDRGDNHYDHQVIKVFSVSSRARVVYDFWVKVSKYLAQQGVEYRDRCIYREVIRTSNGPVNVPASFNHLDYTNPELVMEDGTNMSELHETIVLEKFTPVTKSLYNSILADMEAVLPMALNPDEKAIVRHYGTSVVVGRSGTGKTTALIYKMRANAQLPSRSDSSRPTRQLFVTRSKVLTKHIASNYRGLIESSEVAFKSAGELEEMRKANQKYQNRELVEFDNEVDLRDDLPRQFSQLTDANFPLFVSFEKLCDLLEGDMAVAKGLTPTRVGPYTHRLITFSDFKHRYWPKFDYRLTRHLDPALVYSEILGVIKGHGHTLGKEEYLSNLSHKKSPLLAGVRHQVYAIFEAYAKKSSRNYETDAADRTRAILSHYESGLRPEHQVDYIFVDEVQDHLMADVYLLQSLCSNLDGGYWCGDTAQTINIGSSFRIKDLRAYLYENMQPNQDASRRQRKTAAPFATFELTVNFRSHGGIVKYAASLVELIYTLFPSSIDRMQPESAKTPGKAPELFIGPVDDEALFVSHLLGKKPADQATPFGAQQAIIVRSESTAKSLTSRLQKRCTVISLHETKGLEFDDLVLYNFFAESEAPTSAWEIILELSVHNEDGRVKYAIDEVPVSISPILCSELKQLYVAVTRARHRCWLWDSGTTIDLMGEFWKRLELITISGSLEKLSTFAVSSKDLRLWAQRGQDFFSNGLYELAATCFERAGQSKEAKIAEAYQHMSEAKTFPDNSRESKNAFIGAAERMKACAESSDREGLSHSSVTLWYHAATCFETAKEVSRASQSYCKGGFYDQAALVCFKAQDMDGCLDLLLSHGTRMDASLANKIREVSLVYYLRERRYSQLKRLFGGSLQRCIEFARSLKFSAQLKELLRMNRQFKELADVHLEDGSPAEAIHCLRQNLSDSSTIEQSRKIVSTYLWAKFGLGATPNAKSTEQAKELINICRSPLLPGGLGDYSARHDLELFDTIISRANISLDLQSAFHDLDPANGEDRARIILIQYHVLRANKWISADSYHTFSSHLREWSEYTTSIKWLESLENPCQHITVRRLLGLSDSTPPATEPHSICIPNGSFLQTSSSIGRGPVRGGKKQTSGSTWVTANVANQRIRTSLAEHLKTRLSDLHLALLESPWTQPGSPWHAHNPVILEENFEAIALPCPSVEELIPSLASVYLALNPVKGSSSGNVKNNCDADKIQVVWITRIFNVLFPESGSIQNIKVLLALSGPDSINIIRTWVSETLESLDPTKHKHNFATLLVICLALASELYPNRLPVKVVPHVPLKKGVYPPPGCLKQPNRFAEALFVLFQRDSRREFSKVIDAIGLLVEHELSMDLSALVHIVEQAVREVILSVRASTRASEPTLCSGFSGLIAPFSWTVSLATHVKQIRVLEPLLVSRLLGHMKAMLGRLSGGLPAYWKSLNRESRKHTIGSLMARLLWSICFVVVNLCPGDPLLFVALDAIKKTTAEAARCYDALVDNFKGIGVDWKVFSEISSQQSCLSVLSQTFQHEDLVLLTDGSQHISSAKQHFVHRVLPFKDFADLRAKLGASVKGFVTTAGPSPPTVEPALHETSSKTPRPNANHPPETSVVIADSETAPLAQPVQTLEANTPPQVEVELPLEERESEIRVVQPAMTAEDAALRILTTWRRWAEKRRRQPPQLVDFDDEGQLYERYSQTFLKMGKKVLEDTRDRISARLVRGACLYIILGLQMLVEEMNDYLECLDEELKAPGLDSNELADVHSSIQERKEKIRKHQGEVNECLSRGTAPPLLKAKNLSGIRTHAGKAWDAFMLVKNSKTLPHNDSFEEVEELISRGRDIVLRTLTRYAKTK